MVKSRNAYQPKSLGGWDLNQLIKHTQTHKMAETAGDCLDGACVLQIYYSPLLPLVPGPGDNECPFPL